MVADIIDCNQNLFLLPTDRYGVRHHVLNRKLDRMLAKQVPVLGITVSWWKWDNHVVEVESPQLSARSRGSTARKVTDQVEPL
ncbi:MAG: hypothetical protein V7774_08805 [Pseudorhizobium pelagicum]|uniref:hypothetical protein n=1 Tax=Pseudorhizobium pelagicum TaxID=1509405 RepID=UPI00345F236A